MYIFCALIKRFNTHCKDTFTHVHNINVDELAAWSFACCRPEGVKKLGRKLKDTGQEMKILAAMDVRVITALEQVRNSKVSKNRKCSKEHRKPAAVAP